MTEYSRIASGTFTTAATPVTQVINLPFQPQRVRLFNKFSAANAPAQYALISAEWDVNMGQGLASMQYIESAGAPWIDAVDYVTANGISTFSAGTALQYGPAQQIIGITAANPAVVNVTAHGYAVGDTVVLQGLIQSSTTGMQQISGIPFTISAVGDADHFTIQWDASGSNYTAMSGSKATAKVKKVLYPFLYLPEDNVVAFVTTGTTTTIVTTMYHNFEPGQEIAFRIPKAWGVQGLNSLPNTQGVPGSPMYGYVTSVTDNWTFVCSINSSSFTDTFNVNQPFASYPGEQFPQVLAVGDVNTGGLINGLSATNLYPSPQFPTSSSRVPTINGPAVRGAFVNNTSQGFIVGLGVGAVQSNAKLLTASSVYFWEALYYDYGS